MEDKETVCCSFAYFDTQTGGAISWEQRKFGELYRKSSEKNDGSRGMDKNITVATMQYKDDVKVSTEEYLRTYYTFNIGDIAFEYNGTLVKTKIR